jgi:hypothetical protein
VQRLRAIAADPEMPEGHGLVWSESAAGELGRELNPGNVHKPADQVLLDALRAAGWGTVSDEYETLVQAAGGDFWYE